MKYRQIIRNMSYELVQYCLSSENCIHICHRSVKNTHPLDALEQRPQFHRTEFRIDDDIVEKNLMRKGLEFPHPKNTKFFLLLSHPYQSHRVKIHSLR